MAAVHPAVADGDLDTCLLEMIAWGGNARKASQSLAERGIEVAPPTLVNWCRTRHQARYLELREKYAAQQEQQLIHTYRDMAAQAVDAMGKAIHHASDRLDRGLDDDPAKTAASMAKVAQSMTDKMLSLSGRPTSIREDRSLGEIMRSLAAKGIIEIPSTDEPPELEAGE